MSKKGKVKYKVIKVFLKSPNKQFLKWNQESLKSQFVYSNIKYAIAEYLFCANPLNIICYLEGGGGTCQWLSRLSDAMGLHLFGLMWPKVSERVAGKGAAQGLATEIRKKYVFEPLYFKNHLMTTFPKKMDKK